MIGSIFLRMEEPMPDVAESSLATPRLTSFEPNISPRISLPWLVAASVSSGAPLRDRLDNVIEPAACSAVAPQAGRHNRGERLDGGPRLFFVEAELTADF
jgi:hypothetical protein